jgi:hypothetical protein
MLLDEIGAGLLNRDDQYNDNHSQSTTRERLVQRAG